MDFNDFERALILLGSLYCPDPSILRSYILFTENIIEPLIRSHSKRVSQATIEKLAELSAIVLEKNKLLPFSASLIKVQKSSSRRSRSAEVETQHKGDSLGKRDPVSRLEFDKLIRDIKSSRFKKAPPHEQVAVVPPEPLLLDDSPNTHSEPIPLLNRSVVLDSPKTQVRLVPPTDSNVPVENASLFPDLLDEHGEVRYPALRPGFPPRNKIVPVVTSQLVSVLEEPELVLAPRNSSHLERMIQTHNQTLELMEVLKKSFGTLDLAFDFIDGSVGNRSGKISMTKFSFGVRATKFNGDWKAIFHHIDVKSDGCIDLNELRSWKDERENQIMKLKRFYGVGDSILQSSN